MPQLIVPEGFFQVAYQWSGPGTGSQPVNVLGFQMGAGATPSDINDVIDQTSVALTTVAADAYTIINAILTVGSSSGPPYITGEQQPGVAEGRDVAAAPPNVSYLLAKSSSMPGRRGKGRLFIPGVDEGAVDNGGVIGGTALGALQSCADTLSLLTEEIATFAGFAILHHEGDPDENPAENVQFTARTLVATQRRRLRN